MSVSVSVYVCLCLCLCPSVCVRHYIYIGIFICIHMSSITTCKITYEVAVYVVAATSRLHKIIGLFCRIQSLLQGSFAKETYNFKEPINRSHPISRSANWRLPWLSLQRSTYICVYICMHTPICEYAHLYMYIYINTYTRNSAIENLYIKYIALAGAVSRAARTRYFRECHCGGHMHIHACMYTFFYIHMRVYTHIVLFICIFVYVNVIHLIRRRRLSSCANSLFPWMPLWSTYAYMYICTYIYTYTYTYIHTYLHVHIHVGMCQRNPSHTQAPPLELRELAISLIATATVDIYIDIYIQRYIYIHTHTNMWISSHAQAPSLELRELAISVIATAAGASGEQFGSYFAPTMQHVLHCMQLQVCACVHVRLCLSVGLSVCLSVCLSVYLCLWLCLCWSWSWSWSCFAPTMQHVLRWMQLQVCVCVCVYVCVCVCVCVRVCICV